VVQRYGAGVAGGAESLTRMLAEQLSARGDDVSVLTSCAVDYRTWRDDFTPGITVEAGVTVHRLSVPKTRDAERFGALSARTIGRQPPALVQQAWMREQGPVPERFVEHLGALASHSDVAMFMTYLYPTTYFGIRSVSSQVPTILHPTAHDELPMRIPLIRENFDHATGLAYSTPEEQALVETRFRPTATSSVIGIGFDPSPPTGDAERFRSTFGLGTDPYLLYMGRIDPNKAADEAIELVRSYRRLRGSRLRLVLVGQPAMEIPDDDGIAVTGFVDDSVRWDALAGSVALLQPSYQESFSMVVAESWTAGVPGLVQGRCDVLAGLAERSGGALAYSDGREFVASVDLLLESADLRTEMGRRGRQHVLDNFTWDVVMERYESLIEASVDSFAASKPPSRRR